VTEKPVVRVERLSKRFRLYRSARDRLADWLHLPSWPRFKEFWALREVSFELRPGECLGIIGPNGAGKSTLLKLLTGALYPTCGALEVRGRVLSLLELGTGFSQDLTGRQNIQQSARLLDLRPGYAAEHMAEIESFAEIGEYFDRPVKFYSSGMLVRLAFSLFSTLQPDVFLVDEALAVGDLRFASKALSRIRHMMDDGTTLLFVSHDMHLVNRLCTRVVWLHAGTVQMDGAPSEVTRAYQQFVVHGALEQSSDGRMAEVAGPELDSPMRSPLFVGSGWGELEAYGGEIFRWADSEATLVLPEPGEVPRDLLLELEPGPSAARLPMRILATGASAAGIELSLGGRQTVRVPVAPTSAGPVRLRLRTAEVGKPAPGDERWLSFRVFRWGWSDEGEPSSIQNAAQWVDATHEVDLRNELIAMRAALQRSAPIPDAPVRITRVVTRNGRAEEAVRFATHELLTLEISVDALASVKGLVVGLQVRDAFDRMLSSTRTDWQAATLPDLEAGQSLTAVFSSPDLLLGPGLYQLTVAICHDAREDRICHWVDGVWRFEVLNLSESSFAGLLDLGWRYSGAWIDGENGVPTASSGRTG
jgi:ABC-type polysaccharide/polyol phosphate transport system ATPase subunit